MFFTNPRSVIKSTNIPISTVKSKANITMNIFQLPKPKPPPKIQQTVTQINQKKDTMLWGAPTWYFFHTIAAKIKPEEFQKFKLHILDIIKNICYNLPCPSCTEHAKQYIQRMDTNSIICKDDLIKFLFVFHNNVNARKHKPVFSYEELIEKYKNANLINITNNFLYYFKMEHHSVRMIADGMHRRSMAKNIQNWLHTNIHIFDR
jgi:hypothetical protein